MNILDPRFQYVCAAETDVAATWRRFGFIPERNQDRRARWRQESPGAPATQLRAMPRDAEARDAPH